MADCAENMLDVQNISSELKIRPEIYTKIVKSFSETLLKRVDALEAALAGNDQETMRKILHEIKGTSGNLRLKSIAAAGHLMHDEVKTLGRRKELGEYLALMKIEAEKLKQTVSNL